MIFVCDNKNHQKDFMRRVKRQHASQSTSRRDRRVNQEKGRADRLRELKMGTALQNIGP